MYNLFVNYLFNFVKNKQTNNHFDVIKHANVWLLTCKFLCTKSYFLCLLKIYFSVHFNIQLYSLSYSIYKNRKKIAKEIPMQITCMCKWFQTFKCIQINKYYEEQKQLTLSLTQQSLHHVSGYVLVHLLKFQLHHSFFYLFARSHKDLGSWIIVLN